MADNARVAGTTVPTAVRKRLPAFLAVVLCGMLLGIVFSLRGGGAFAATSTFVVQTPQLDAGTGAQGAAVSPDRYVNDQVALFELDTLLDAAATLAADELRTQARLRATGTVEVNSGDPVVLGRNGSIQLRRSDRRVAVEADGTMAVDSAGGLRLTSAGALLHADGRPVQGPDGNPVTAAASDTVIVREDGLVIVAPATASPVAVAADGTVIDLGPTQQTDRDDGSITSIAGLARSDAGTVLVSFGDNAVRIEPSLRPVVVGGDGAPLTRPGSGDLVGVAESRLLLRLDGAFVARSGTDTATFDIDPAQRALFDLEAQVLQRQGDVVIGPPTGEGPAAVTALDAQTIRDGLVVHPRSNSNVVQVTFTAASAEEAVTVANATVEAYQQLNSTGVGTERGAAQARAQQAIDVVSGQLVEVESQLTALVLANPDRQALESQYGEILGELVDAGRQLIDSPAQGAAAANRINDLVSQINAIEQVQRVGLNQGAVADLNTRRTQLRDRLNQLQAQLDSLTINVDGGNDPIALSSPATDAEAVEGLGALQLGFVGFVFAAIIGGAAAYALELRRPTVDSAEQVAFLLDAPLLSEVPDFKHERIRGQLPVLKSPSSYSAEAIRMAAVALTMRGATGRGALIGVVSGGVGDGKTTIATNLAMALAGAKRRVLAIDADLEGQVMSHLMRRQANWSTQWRGMIDVIESSAELQAATRLVKLDDGTDLELLTAGTGAARLRTLLDTPAMEELFRTASASYDAVIVDLPPLLNVAYAPHLLRLLDGVVVVTASGAAADGIEEVAERLHFLDVTVLGFIYNRAPLRVERTSSVSALHYDLGGRPMNRRRWAKRRLRRQRQAEQRRDGRDAISTRARAADRVIRPESGSAADGPDPTRSPDRTTTTPAAPATATAASATAAGAVPNDPLGEVAGDAQGATVGDAIGDLGGSAGQTRPRPSGKSRRDD